MNTQIVLKKHTVVLGIGIIGLLLLFTFSTLIRAESHQITVCVRKNGVMRLLATANSSDECHYGETELSWNTQGLPGPQGEKGDSGEQGLLGPKGEKGDRGEPAQHGAGNIAFVYGFYLLKTDGTVWVAGAQPGNNPPYTLIDCVNYSGITDIPLPISEIIVWEYKTLLDKNGNYWITGNTCPNTWQNIGPIP